MDGWIFEDRIVFIVKDTYGAVFVSNRICLFFKSWTSGRCWRCFSKLSRRSKLRVGEMGVSSMVVVASVMMVVLKEFVLGRWGAGGTYE
jgi:hypothetical protein